MIMLDKGSRRRHNPGGLGTYGLDSVSSRARGGHSLCSKLIMIINFLGGLRSKRRPRILAGWRVTCASCPPPDLLRWSEGISSPAGGVCLDSVAAAVTRAARVASMLILELLHASITRPRQLLGGLVLRAGGWRRCCGAQGEHR